MHLISPKIESAGRSSVAGPARRRGLAFVVILVIALAACGGASSAAPAVPSVAPTATPSGAPAAAAQSVAPTSAAPSTGGSSTTAGIPSDPCSVVQKADVEAAFGGSSSAGKIDENGACVFDVSGKLKAGGPGPVPVGVSVSFTDSYETYAREKVVFGDAVTKIDGLGSEAWYALTALHVQIPGGELVVDGLGVGDFDKAVMQQSTVDLGKAVLAHL
jgi:hypothetical protein